MQCTKLSIAIVQIQMGFKWPEFHLVFTDFCTLYKSPLSLLDLAHIDVLLSSAVPIAVN